MIGNNELTILFEQILKIEILENFVLENIIYLYLRG